MSCILAEQSRTCCPLWFPKCKAILQDNDPKHTDDKGASFSQTVDVLDLSSQSLYLISTQKQFLQILRKAKIPQNKQEVNLAAVQAWQSIAREDTKCLMMSMGHRLQTVNECTRFRNTDHIYSYANIGHLKLAIKGDILAKLFTQYGS